jgi:chitinase
MCSYANLTGFALTATSCMNIGCAYSGFSNPAPCPPDSTGVVSLNDIRNIISQKGLTPVLDQTQMVKQITYDNQWIGYDDADTVALKKQWANNYCFGGTMIWTLDLGAF